MAVLAAGVVSRWRELATGELRERVQQLVAARLDADHAVWKTIRRDPVLTARVRGVLSGMATSVHGTRDEHMRRVWITAARNALENTPPAPPAPVRKPRVVAPPVPDLLVEPAPDSAVAGPVAEHEPAEPVEPPAPADQCPDPPAATEDPVQPAFTSAPPPVTPITASPRAPIPPMVFSGP